MARIIQRKHVDFFQHILFEMALLQIIKRVKFLHLDLNNNK